MLDGIINFDQTKIGYVQNPYNDLWKVDSGHLTVDYAYLNSLKKYNLVIIDMCEEHWGDRGAINLIKSIFTDAQITYLILSHCPTDHDPDNMIIFFPLFYHWSIKHFQRSVVDFTNRRDFNLGCLNSNPRPHRIANYLKLSKKSYFKYSSVTLSNTRDSGSTRNDDISLTSEELNFWDNISLKLPTIKPAMHFSAAGLRLPALTDSYTHLVTEAAVFPRVFITEKIWKPIVSGQLFFVLGSPGTIKFLQEVGVDVFNDYINHDHYDNEEDWRTRLDLLYEVIDDFMSKDLYSIYQETVDRRITNCNKFYSGEFDPVYKNTLIKIIKEYS